MSELSFYLTLLFPPLLLFKKSNMDRFQRQKKKFVLRNILSSSLTIKFIREHGLRGSG